MERRKHIYKLIAIAMLLALVGCEQLYIADILAVKTVRVLVTEYCKLAPALREANRERWKENLYPNGIEITCKF